MQGEIIFGIDPGLANTGFGVIERTGTSLQPLWYGHVSTPASDEASERLVTIHDACEQVIERFRPDVMAIESLFFGASAPAALAVGQARGVLMHCTYSRGVAVHEYEPTRIKQAVTGYGRADKKQVQQMVAVLLRMTEEPKPDQAADALAVAICHSSAAGLARSTAKARRAGLTT